MPHLRLQQPSDSPRTRDRHNMHQSLKCTPRHKTTHLRLRRSAEATSRTRTVDRYIPKKSHPLTPSHPASPSKITPATHKTMPDQAQNHVPQAPYTHKAHIYMPRKSTSTLYNNHLAQITNNNNKTSHPLPRPRFLFRPNVDHARTLQAHSRTASRKNF